jgi:hypothetical protein
MISALIYLLFILLVLIIVWYVVRLVAAHFGLPAVAIQIIGLILALIFLLYALNVLGLGPPLHLR